MTQVPIEVVTLIFKQAMRIEMLERENEQLKEKLVERIVEERAETA